MSYSLFADDQPARAPSAPIIPLPEHAVSLPELERLNTLRDALLLLKVPLANSCGLRGLIERQLLSNDVHDRVLGKSSTSDSPASAPTLP
ncbi:MAG TPA: hypothetical protein DIT33_12295 [Pseudomonas sp.]|uniref:Uncharacterized protein n=1 Tax=Pseudomonas helleri TaxID=1608996 RepID=A0A6A7ZCH0_9PSED|nr:MULTISPECIES: hypothetical protein [Pseudomonas]MQT75038.1 hypothetical protein [Pseudomonas helleri]MQU42550.1 hypothetical protein [Pseudomonas helleri]MQU58260.1 hypothetical protein [Pseudomonas helleri]HCN64159.1 hypothetical protein [Pseudomonas sp.]